jgi:hypothetical protein
VLVEGLSPWHFRHQILATPVVALALFAGPLLVFQRALWKSKMQGTFEYGVLATKLGRRFEARWLNRRSRVDDDALEAPDFSATTDLFTIVANVRASRLWLLDSSVIVPLLVAVLLPFAPLLVAVVPVEEILAFLWKTVV